MEWTGKKPLKKKLNNVPRDEETFVTYNLLKYILNFCHQNIV